MTSQLLAERGNNESEPQEKVMVLVAKRNLEIGQIIKDPKDFFKEKPYVKGEEPAKCITDKDYDQLKDKRLSNRLAMDQFVSTDDLVDKNKNSLGQRLPKGMRAVGIKVNIESIAGGFAALPLSRVDIISVLRRGDDDSLSQTILENVLVLAADDQTQRNDKNAMPANTVTVALTPDDAELVMLAQEMGTLRLVLRPDGDTETGKTKGIKSDRIRKRLLAGRSGGSSGTEPPAKGNPLVAKVNDLDIKDKPKTEVKEEPKTKVEPKVDAKPEPKTEPEPPAESKTRTHILTVYNGDQGRRYPFRLDADGKVVQDEITRSDPEPRPEPKARPKQPDKPAEPKKTPAPGKEPKPSDAPHG
jgi:pilus assembly protein CpaB